MKMEPPPRLFSHQCPEGEQVVSANFAITEFSEVPPSPGPMLSGIHPIIPARIMAPPRQGTPDRDEAVFFPRSLQKIPKILARNGCRNVQETLARYSSEVTSLAGAERMLKA